ncbi:MAG: tryptophan-rich sensory protein [Anaerolineae bacterium]|nr:tryptophan-rich sensory protein [Anaerolineae bacterium]
MNKDILRQAVVIVAVIATIVINGLANALPLNGQTTGEISDRFQVYFVPAGYVFSIWGLIYLGLVVFAVYQALPSQRENPHLRRIGYPFALSCLANIAWLFLWHYEYFPLTLIAMIALLLLLIAIYVWLGIGQTIVPAVAQWLVHVPFSIYLGWITVATIANVASVLDYLNWGRWGLSAEVWTVIMLLVGVGLAWAISFIRGDVAYVLVIIWAFMGIAVKYSNTPVVSIATWVATGLVVLALVAGVIVTKQRKARVTLSKEAAA